MLGLARFKGYTAEAGGFSLLLLKTDMVIIWSTRAWSTTIQQNNHTIVLQISVLRDVRNFASAVVLHAAWTNGRLTFFTGRCLNSLGISKCSMPSNSLLHGTLSPGVGSHRQHAPRAALQQKRLPHCYVLTGVSGSGKRSESVLDGFLRDSKNDWKIM